MKDDTYLSICEVYEGKVITDVMSDIEHLFANRTHENSHGKGKAVNHTVTGRDGSNMVWRLHVQWYRS